MTTIDEMRESAGEAADAISTLILSVNQAIAEGRAEPQKAPEVVKAISEVLRTVGELVLPAPEGVEFDMHVFLACDAVGAETCLHYPGNRMTPPRQTGPVDVGALLDALPLEQRVKLLAVGNWRVMTRQEITAYKIRQIRATGRA